MRVTILGSGSAAGVPSVSGGWGSCDPANPKNRRRRSSILVEEGPTSILIDTSPDLREQMLDANIRHLNAVVYTHAHADHTHGIDELREMTRILKGPLPVHGTAETLAALETRFAYVFKPGTRGGPVFRPWLEPNLMTPLESFHVGNIRIKPFPQDHGFSNITMGLNFGDVVYSTDLVEIPEDSKQYIRGAKLWVLGVLSDMPYATHVHLDKALAWIDELKPQRTVITHMSNALDYERLLTLLPVGVTAGFDGLVVEV